MELDYEGDPSFLKDGLEELLFTMSELSNGTTSETEDEVGEEALTTENGSTVSSSENNGQIFNHSTNAIATHYSAKSCADLVLCAVIQLQLVQGKVGCTREEIVEAMKIANNFYKVSMRGSNLTSAFSSLAKKKKLNELHGGKYSLTAAEKQNAETQLAGNG